MPRMRGPLAFLAGASWTLALMAAQSHAADVPQWKPGCGTPVATNPTAGYTAGMGPSDREGGPRN